MPPPRYAYDHDEYLRLAHFAHHTSINRNYAIYSRASDASAKPDLVKQRLVFCSPNNSDGAAQSDIAATCTQK
jgi:hypothetical protein